jgi:hypothetical protein
VSLLAILATLVLQTYTLTTIRKEIKGARADAAEARSK